MNDEAIYTKNYTEAQWWHVANPYPSYIDVTNSAFDMGAFDKKVYVVGSDNVISTIDVNDPGLSTPSGTSQFISPGQCMWLYNSESSAVSISKGARVHSMGGLKSASVAPNDVLRVGLHSEFSKDETVIAFREYGSAFYTSHDAKKMMSGGKVANLYSIKDGKNIVINLHSVDDNSVIPLGYKVDKSGLSDFTIRVADISGFIPELSVLLKDYEEDVVVNLREVEEYTFTPSATSSDDRFELIFESLTTGIEQGKESISEGNMLIYAVGRKAIVQVTDELLKGKDRLIEVYDLSGQLKVHKIIDDAITEVNLPYGNAVFIVKVSIDNLSHQEKVTGSN